MPTAFEGFKQSGNIIPVKDATAQATLEGILDGTDIDSFGDVETALATKVDKVQGKGLSSNDYDDSAKAIVDGVTTALDGKVSKSNTAGLLKNDGTVDEVAKMPAYNINHGLKISHDAETGQDSLQVDYTDNVTQSSAKPITSGAVSNYAFPRSEQAVLGAKNRWNFPAWKSVGISDATATWDDDTYTLTLTSTDTAGRTHITVPTDAQIDVVPNEKIKFV
jgi:hypothetical protein